MTFADRKEAGQKLAVDLSKYRGREVVVYAIPRGGVVLGAEIARELHAPLDLLIVRKVGHPHNSEYAVCVVAEDGHELCNPMETSLIDKEWLNEEKQKERMEARRRREVYLADRRRPSVAGKTAIVVDDGVATGMTFLMALREAKEMKPSQLVAAVPVMPLDFLDKIKQECDEVVCLEADPNFLGAVGAYYSSFPQVDDQTVKELMEMSKQ